MKIKKIIEFHINEEEKLIKNLSELISLIEDEKALFLISTILIDEYKHHKQLKSIEKVILDKETVTESDFWNAVWKDLEDLDLYDKGRA